MPEYIQVVTTTDSIESAERISSAVVEDRLAACVQISQCTSIYRWQGKVENAAEYVCTMKSRSDLFELLESTVKKVHPYEVPELLATGIRSVGSDYLAWLESELQPPESR